MTKKLGGQGSSLQRKEEKGSEQEGNCYKCGYERHAMDKCLARRSTYNLCNKQGHFASANKNVDAKGTIESIDKNSIVNVWFQTFKAEGMRTSHLNSNLTPGHK